MSNQAMFHQQQKIAQILLDKYEVEAALRLIEKLKTRAAALATTWACARHGSHYNAYPGSIRFDVEQGKIYYFATPITSGVMVSGALDMKYLWEDDSLEADAKKKNAKPRPKRRRRTETRL